VCCGWKLQVICGLIYVRMVTGGEWAGIGFR